MKIRYEFYNPDGTKEMFDNKVINAEWEYLRNGGCYRGVFDLALDLETTSLLHSAPKKSGVKVYIKDDTGDYTQRYDGYMTLLRRHNDRGRHIVEMRTAGYIEQMKRFRITAEPSYPDTVVNIIKDLLDTYITPNTTIIYDPSDIVGTFNVDDLVLTGMNVLEAISLLSIIQGGCEYGVNSARQFYHKAVSTAVGQVDIDVRDLDFKEHGKILDPLANYVRLYGGIVASDYSHYTRTGNDPGAIAACCQREVKILEPAIITDTVADQFITNYLAVSIDPNIMLGYRRNVDDFDWIEYKQPIDKVRTHFKGISSNVNADMYVNQVKYVTRNNKKSMLMELGTLLNNMRGGIHNHI